MVRCCKVFASRRIK